MMMGLSLLSVCLVAPILVYDAFFMILASFIGLASREVFAVRILRFFLGFFASILLKICLDAVIAILSSHQSNCLLYLLDLYELLLLSILYPPLPISIFQAIKASQRQALILWALV